MVGATDEFSMDRIQSTYQKAINDVAGRMGIDSVEFRIVASESVTDSSSQINEVKRAVLTRDLGEAKGADSIDAVSGSDVSSVVRNPDSTSPSNCLTQTGSVVSSDFEAGERRHDSISKKKSTDSRPGRPRYSLRDFVFDESNEMIWKACSQAIQSPGDISPLYLYGGAGIGKTHLLEGIAAQVRRRSRSGRVRMVTAEQFTSDYVGSLKNRTMPMFRKKYRELDYLLVDDIQFFAGKKSTLQELQQTIEVVTRRGGQVIVSSDRSPSELEFAGPEFIHRVSCGLTAQIQPAGKETRQRIVAQLASQKGLRLEETTIQLIADKVSGDIRLVSGALNRLRLFQLIDGRSVTIKDAKRHLADLFQIARRSVSIPEIEKAVCDLFGLEQKCLRSSTKVKAVSQPRMLAMWLSRKYTRAALSEIGDYFGGRSHSTVISAQSKVDQWVEKSELIGLKHSEFPVENAIRRIEQELRVG